MCSAPQTKIQTQTRTDPHDKYETHNVQEMALEVGRLSDMWTCSTLSRGWRMAQRVELLQTKI